MVRSHSDIFQSSLHKVDNRAPVVASCLQQMHNRRSRGAVDGCVASCKISGRVRARGESDPRRLRPWPRPSRAPRRSTYRAALAAPRTDPTEPLRARDPATPRPLDPSAVMCPACWWCVASVWLWARPAPTAGPGPRDRSPPDMWNSVLPLLALVAFGGGATFGANKALLDCARFAADTKIYPTRNFHNIGGG